MRPYYMLFSIILYLASIGCSKPAVPIGVKYAEVQKLALWSADAQTFTPDRYQDYAVAYNDAKNRFIKEYTRFPWLRDYASIRGG